MIVSVKQQKESILFVRDQGQDMSTSFQLSHDTKLVYPIHATFKLSWCSRLLTQALHYEASAVPIKLTVLF